MENTTMGYEKKDQHQYQLLAQSLYPKLKRAKEEGDNVAFNNHLLKLLPRLKKYIGKRLRTALTRQLLPIRKYQPEYYLDELFIVAHDRFGEIKNSNNFYAWLFEKADRLMEETIEKEEFNSKMLENLDNYSKLEWEGLKEKYTRDGDGDFVLLEELDDISYKNHERPMVSYFFGQYQQQAIRKMDEEFGRDKVDRHLDMVLYNMPLEMQVVFDLLVYHHFNLEEIAQIRNCSVQHIEEILKEAQKIMDKSLDQKYLNI